MDDEQIKGLAALRAPFPDNQISKLPKPTKAQTDAVRADFKAGIRCQICGGWHHKDVIHLDYVGHAALTDRLLSVDPAWSWEPVAFNAEGLPAIDKLGGLWIRLSVLGVTRLGYGHPDGKSGGDAIKEAIGDALRNAAMRFGCALDLWHKGDLHAHEEKQEDAQESYESICERLTDAITEIKIGINKSDYERASFAWSTLSEEDKMALWRAPSKGGCFTTEERTIMKSPEFRQAYQPKQG
jgi:hypothetical protein